MMGLGPMSRSCSNQPWRSRTGGPAYKGVAWIGQEGEESEATVRKARGGWWIHTGEACAAKNDPLYLI